MYLLQSENSLRHSTGLAQSDLGRGKDLWFESPWLFGHEVVHTSHGGSNFSLD